MEQNTQYLYEYKDGRRIRNIGFLKIEQQLDKCVITIHAREMDEVMGICFRKNDGEMYTAGWMEEQITPQMETVEISTQEQLAEVDDYIQPSSVTYEKISRQDLSRLPRKDWRLANNSFLLHGFYNYHHLLYIEEEGQIWIGVPGIYHEKEKMAANTFGFTDFRRVTDVDIDLKEDEQNVYEDFGYWCRQIVI